MTFPPADVPDSPVPMRGRRRGGALFPTLVILAVLAIAFIGFTSFYTDLLWFRSVGFSSVFTTELWTRIGLFVSFGAVMALIVALNASIAYRLRPTFRGLSPEQQSLDRYRVAIDPYRRVLVAVVATGLGLLAGASAASEWRTYLVWRNSTPFGKKDPQFGKDVSFFTFDLPWFRYVMGFFFAVLVMSIIVSLVVHYLYGGIKLQTPGERVTQAATAHLSVLLGVFMLLKALSYWLDRFQLAVTTNSLFTGLNYAQVNAVLPAKNILLVIALLTAVLFFANVFRRTWSLPFAALGLLVLSAIVIGALYPAFVQRFQVRPSQATKEQPYIQRNIDATRDAFGLSKVKVIDYPAKTSATATEVARDAGTIANVRLIDPSVVPPTFNQLQQIRGYYSFADTLDVDRYKLNGAQRDSVVAVREINLDGAPTRNWINDHTVYTHGFGMVAAYGNTSVNDGQPSFFESNIPPTGLLNIKQPRVYFGELSPDYSIVGAAKDAPKKELDYPDDSAAAQQNNTYDGTGGVPMGSWFNRLLFAVKYQEGNMLLSNSVNKDSKILYDRTPKERVEKAAPWLTVDGDPYPAVVNGRIVWLIDGYTTSNGYPYSSRTSLGDVTADSLTANSQVVAAQARSNVNYIRNSVKATVDAYDGTVTLYEWDTQDPVLKTWSKAFPGTVKPRADLKGDLLSHVRYPEDLFKVQRDLLSRYHVTDASSFYTGQDFWTIPDDPTKPGVGESQPPYYLSVKMPGTTGSSFSLTTTYAPNNRQTLAAFMAVNSAPGSDYGTIRVLQLPRNTTIPGPVQVQNNIESNPLIASQLSLLRRSGSDVVLGNLLSLPVGGGLLYVEPIYVKGTAQNSYPLLQKVVVAFGNNIAFENTFQEALTKVFKGDTGVDTSNGTSTSPPTSTPNQTLTYASVLAEVQAAYDQAQAALKAGDLTAFAAAQKRLGAALDKADQINPTTAPTPTASP